MENNPSTQYKWYILSLGTLSHIFAVGAASFGMPVLFSEISRDLDLTLVQLGAIWGVVSLAGLLASFAGGILGDRFGCKRTLAAACLLAGIFGGTRGLSSGFITMFISMFCFGFPIFVITLHTHKATSIWFPGTQLGLVNGILAASMGAGIAVGCSINATLLSPLLGGWRNVIFLWAAVSIILSLLWSFSRRDPELSNSGTGSHMGSFKEGVSQVLKIKSVWMLALSGLLLMACQVGMFGYLPLFLRNSGWDARSADIAFSLLGVLGAVGAISISFISDRIGSRKKMLLLIHVVTTIAVGFLAVANFHMIWILIIIIGLVREAYPAISTTFLMELKEIDRKNLGTAMGLRGSVTMIGSFLGPPLGNSLANISAGLPFIFWAVLALTSIIFLLMINE